MFEPLRVVTKHRKTMTILVIVASLENKLNFTKGENTYSTVCLTTLHNLLSEIAHENVFDLTASTFTVIDRNS
jgi:hypothetical protein